MTKKLSLLSLFAAAMLCAAPTLSLKNAFMPEANLAVSLNLGTINNSFVGDFVNHDVIGTLGGFMDIQLDPKDPAQNMLKALIEQSTIVVAGKFSAADVQGIEGLSPADALKKLVVCIEFPQPLGPMVDLMIGQLSASQPKDIKVKPMDVNGFKGLKAVDEDGVAIVVAFSADTKFAFAGTEENLKKQLTEEAAAAAPAKLVAALQKGYAGGTATIAIAVTDEIKGMAGQGSPEAAGYLAILETLTIAANAKQANLDIKLAGAFSIKDIADEIKSMLDEGIPGLKQMAPMVAGEADLSFLDTIATAQDGNTVSVSIALSQQDIMTIVAVAGKFMNDNAADLDDDDDDDDDADFDDDDDGIEVVPVEAD